MADAPDTADPILEVDTPLEDAAEDRLGRRSLAEALARAVMAVQSPAGFVFAVHGGWGTGKTSVLNFVKQALESRSEKDRPLVVPFDPWWYSDADQLLRAFLTQLRSSLAGDSRLWRVSHELGEALQRYSGALGAMVGVLPMPGGSLLGKAVEVGTHAVAGVAVPSADPNAAKDAVARCLRKQGRRAVIFIDDVDRLQDDEIRTLFRLVKAVADFPNTVYVIAFDREVVVKALDRAQEGKGEAYLGKIVQTSVQLPVPDQHTLGSILCEGLNGVLNRHPGEDLEVPRWADLFALGIRPLLETPRVVKQYLNAVASTYPLLAGEVNTVDHLGIQALRAFFPEVHDAIRDLRQELTGVGVESFDVRAAMESALGTVTEHRDAAVRIARQLFPLIEGAYGGHSYGTDWLAHWQRDFRVCSPAFFDRYFSLTVSPGAISVAEVRSLLAAGADATALTAGLGRLLEQPGAQGEPSALEAYLEHLRAVFLADEPTEHAEAWVEAVVAVGDDFLRLDRPRMWGRRNDVVLARCLWPLLREMGQVRTASALAGVITKTPSLSTGVDIVKDLEDELRPRDGTRRPETPTVTEESWGELRDAVVGRIGRAAHDGTLRGVPQLASVLYRWLDWGDTREIAEWLEEWAATQEGLVQLIDATGGVATSQTFGSAYFEASRQAELDFLRRTLGKPALVALADRVEAVLAGRSGAYGSSTIEALSAFVRGVREEGEEAGEGPMADADAQSCGDTSLDADEHTG